MIPPTFSSQDSFGLLTAEGVGRNLPERRDRSSRFVGDQSEDCPRISQRSVSRSQMEGRKQTEKRRWKEDTVEDQTETRTSNRCIKTEACRPYSAGQGNSSAAVNSSLYRHSPHQFQSPDVFYIDPQTRHMMTAVYNQNFFNQNPLYVPQPYSTFFQPQPQVGGFPSGNQSEKLSSAESVITSSSSSSSAQRSVHSELRSSPSSVYCSSIPLSHVETSEFGEKKESRMTSTAVSRGGFMQMSQPGYPNRVGNQSIEDARNIAIDRPSSVYYYPSSSDAPPKTSPPQSNDDPELSANELELNEMEMYPRSPSPLGDDGHPFRRRLRISRHETAILEEFFKNISRPSAMLREKIAKQLNLPVKYVNIWFQNRRAKEKRNENEAHKREMEIFHSLFGPKSSSSTSGAAGMSSPSTSPKKLMSGSSPEVSSRKPLSAVESRKNTTSPKAQIMMSNPVMPISSLLNFSERDQSELPSPDYLRIHKNQAQNNSAPEGKRKALTKDRKQINSEQKILLPSIASDSTENLSPNQDLWSSSSSPSPTSTFTASKKHEIEDPEEY